uniref:Uncharacterized protein n=1 Tax=Ananas comosus var. bracteatus TaxID=296719 RepID=A0A6V7P790_ANACO|nr:unnamed protein product [Ananas comosus var. bracteatus]
MGNSIGGKRRTAKVMMIDGTTLRLKAPAQALDALRDHPGFAVLESEEVKRVGLRARPLDPDAPLKPGKLYFLVDLPAPTPNPTTAAPRRAAPGPGRSASARGSASRASCSRAAPPPTWPSRGPAPPPRSSPPSRAPPPTRAPCGSSCGSPSRRSPSSWRRAGTRRRPPRGSWSSASPRVPTPSPRRGTRKPRGKRRERGSWNCQMR